MPCGFVLRLSNTERLGGRRPNFIWRFIFAKVGLCWAKTIEVLLFTFINVLQLRSKLDNAVVIAAVGFMTRMLRWRWNLSQITGFQT